MRCASSAALLVRLQVIRSAGDPISRPAKHIEVVVFRDWPFRAEYLPLDTLLPTLVSCGHPCEYL